MEDYGLGSYPVTVVHNHWIPLSDGTRLAARLWMPLAPVDLQLYFNVNVEEYNILLKGVEDFDSATNCPCILDCSPFSKDVLTADADFSRLQWFASHGLACCRVDIRGSGNSDGLLNGEYTHQERTDCIEVIRYLAKQKWSSGKLAMYGMGWAGFSGIDLATQNLPELATVITLFSSHCLYGHNQHYIGGCLQGDGMISWANQMHLWNAIPPNPKFCPNWKEKWGQRLEKRGESWLKTWLSHQSEDDKHWKQGSLRYNTSMVEIPILAIGGLADGYVEGAFKMAAKLINPNSRVIIGPWGHEWPDIALPGPQIDFLKLCFCWFQYYLKGPSHARINVEHWPRLQIYMQNGQNPPKSLSDYTTGGWVSAPNWPSDVDYFEKGIDGGVTQFFLWSEGLSSEPKVEPTFTVTLKPNAFQGIYGGKRVSWGKGEGLPGDQSLPAKFATCFTSEPLDEVMGICGHISFFTTIKVSEPGKYAMALTFSHLHSDGTSSLISYGLQNITAFFGKKGIVPANRDIPVRVALKPTAYCVPQGDRVVLTLTPTYFPIGFPTTHVSGIEVLVNSSFIVLQTPELERHKGFQPARSLLRLDTETSEAAPEMEHKIEINDYAKEVEIKEKCGTDLITVSSCGIQRQESNDESFKIYFSCTSASVSAERMLKICFSEPNEDICIRAKAEVEGTPKEFELEQSLEVTLNGETFFSKSWSDKVPRRLV